MSKAVYIVGDVHGKWEELFARINNYEIKDCYLICIGDLGIGFKVSHTKEIRMLEIANTFFTTRDIQFLSIRGNHDNPNYFDGSIKLSNFRLLPDYHIEFINDEKFLFVGGAISIDRKIRQEGVSYWNDEAFVLKPDFAVECDVLITHSAPFWLGSFTKDGILGWCNRDQHLWRDCVKEREELATLFELAKPKKSFCGHFHTSLTQEHNGCVSKILDELEIVELLNQ